MKDRRTADAMGAYFARLTASNRTALERLRKVIRSAAPVAEECISDKLPAFRMEGEVVLRLGVKAKQCVLHLGSSAAIEAHQDKLKAFRTSKNAICFLPDAPLSVHLVRRIVKERIAEFATQQQKFKTAKPRLLSGGNPQIAKGDGNACVQAYISAMPGWKGDVGRRLDSLIVSALPNVRKAVRWNTPFYGKEDRGWFLAFH